MKVVLIAAISMDGFIARHANEFANWTTKEDKQFFVERTKELGVMVMGRVTFETIGRALPGRRMIVMTSRPESFQVPNVEFTKETPVQLVERLRCEHTKGLAVCGGNQIYSSFLSSGRVDEIDLSVVDIELSLGIRLVNDDTDFRVELESSSYLSERVSLQRFRVLRP